MLADVTATHYIAIAGIVTTTGLTLIGWFLKKLDDRNTRQHAEAQQARKQIEDQITGVQSSVTATHDLLVEHIVWHGQNPQPPLRLVKEK